MYSPRATPAVGAMFGTPESARRIPGASADAKFMQREEARALNHGAGDAMVTAVFVLPPSLSELSNEYNKRQRDEPTETEVKAALQKMPPTAPRLGVAPLGQQQPIRQGNVLNSPRLTAALGEVPRNAAWPQGKAPFVLETPYPMATTDSRFADAEADKAALAAVAFSAGYQTAAPVAGMTTMCKSTHVALPSMRKQM